MITVSCSEYRKLQLENFNLKCELQRLTGENEPSIPAKQISPQHAVQLPDNKEKEYCATITKLKEEIQAQRTVSVDVCRRHDELQDALNDKTSQLDKLTRDYEQVQQELQAELEKCNVHTKEITSLEGYVNELTSELERSVQTFIEKDNEIRELNMVISNQKKVWKENQKKIETLEEEVKEDGILIDGQDTYIQELEERVSKLTGDKGVVGDALLDVGGEMEEGGDKEKSRLAAVIKEKEQKIGELEEQVKLLEDKQACQQEAGSRNMDKERINDLDGQVQALRPELEEAKRKYEEQVAIVKKQHQDCVGYQERLKEQHDSIANHNELFTELQKKCINDSAKFDEEIGNLSRARDQLIKFVEEVKDSSEFKEEEPMPLVKQLEELQTHIRNRFQVLKQFCVLMEKTLHDGRSLKSALSPDLKGDDTLSSTETLLPIKMEPLSPPPPPKSPLLKHDSETKCLREVSKSITKPKRTGKKMISIARHLSGAQGEIEDCSKTNSTSFQGPISSILYPHLSSLSQPILQQIASGTEMSSDVEMTESSANPDPCVG